MAKEIENRRRRQSFSEDAVIDMFYNQGKTESEIEEEFNGRSVEIKRIIKQHQAFQRFKKSSLEKKSSEGYRDPIGSNVFLRIIIALISWFAVSVIITLIFGRLRNTDLALLFPILNALNLVFWVWFLFTGKLLFYSYFKSSESERKVKVLNKELLEPTRTTKELIDFKKEIAELKEKSDKDS